MRDKVLEDQLQTHAIPVEPRLSGAAGELRERAPVQDVDHLDRVIADHDIRAVEVAVFHALFVDMGDAARDCRADGPGFSDGEFRPLESAREGGAFEEFHHDGIDFGFGGRVGDAFEREDGDDVRVAGTCEGSRVCHGG